MQVSDSLRTPQRVLSDREIAEDILTSQKHLSNYCYAPAILESTDPALRSTFQQIHNDTQSEAKQVFDYLNQKGWYRPRMADAQAVNDLRNSAQESKQILSSVAQGQGIGQQYGTFGGQYGQQAQSYQASQFGQQGTGYQSGQYGQQGMGYQPGQYSQQGMGYQAGQYGQQGIGYQPGQYGQQGMGYQAGQYGQSGGGYSQFGYSRPWTGTEYGEGQSGMSPSSLYQGAKWGGAPSSFQYGAQSFGGGQYGGQQYGQGQMAGYAQGYQYGQPGAVSGLQYSLPGQWTGTMAGEGQPGMGPSSLYQGARWGGAPTTPYYSIGHQGAGYGQASAGYGQQAGAQYASGYSKWTGTTYGEGQPGMGPSSLYQGYRTGQTFIGNPSNY